MSGGARRAIGALVILVFLTFYLALAATLGGQLANAPWWAQLLFYAVAGVAWAFPLRPLFVWMGQGK
jgi:hypothetical protein